jgi:hypothetical protein
MHARCLASLVLALKSSGGFINVGAIIAADVQEILRFGDLEMGRLGDLLFGDLETWRLGDLEIWRFAVGG